MYTRFRLFDVNYTQRHVNKGLWDKVFQRKVLKMFVASTGINEAKISEAIMLIENSDPKIGQ